MAGEFQVDYLPGQVVYFLVRDYRGRAWSTAAPAFEVYATANLAAYAVPAAEQGMASGFYTADAPAGLPKGEYQVVAKARAGGAPAETDLTVGAGAVGYPPLWFRFLGQAVKSDTGGTIVTKDRDGNTLATQAFTSAAGIDTVNGAT